MSKLTFKSLREKLQRGEKVVQTVKGNPDIQIVNKGKDFFLYIDGEKMVDLDDPKKFSTYKNKKDAANAAKEFKKLMQ